MAPWSNRQDPGTTWRSRGGRSNPRVARHPSGVGLVAPRKGTNGRSEDVRKRLSSLAPRLKSVAPVAITTAAVMTAATGASAVTARLHTGAPPALHPVAAAPA